MEAPAATAPGLTRYLLDQHVADIKSAALLTPVGCSSLLYRRRCCTLGSSKGWLGAQIGYGAGQPLGALQGVTGRRQLIAASASVGR